MTFQCSPQIIILQVIPYHKDVVTINIKIAYSVRRIIQIYYEYNEYNTIYEYIGIRVIDDYKID